MYRRKLLLSFSLAFACQFTSSFSYAEDSISHAEDIETFDLIVTLESASGPSEQDVDDDELGTFVTCRDEVQDQRDMGRDRVLGVVTFQFDNQTGEAALLDEFEGSGVRRGADDNPVYDLEFQNEYVQNDTGFRTEFVETVNALYIPGSRPAFRGTLEEVRTAVVMSNGDSATCHFSYDMRGGTGIYEDEFDANTDRGIFERFFHYLKRQTLEYHFDESSRGVEKFESRSVGPVRG